MSLTAGTKLGPYEIVAPLGAGAMGEVYRARDPRLGRTVAIKVLAAERLSSPGARERFVREAKTIARLSHPHICALHDVGREGGVDFLVMEHLEGETLAARLSRGALPLDQALRCGVQIAGALDLAHRAGVVHRDLKPANVMLTKSGVKLLDFGLAKAAAPLVSAADQSAQPTAEQRALLTEEGAIVGTLAYMAPEQLEGRADARSDLFALGAVLYEMVTGKRAFSAGSRASLISAIVSADPPPIARVQPEAPAALEHVMRACLAKDPDDRWQSAGDVAKELAWIAQSPGDAAVSSASPRPRRERLAWGVAGAALLVAALTALLPRRAPAPTETTRFKVLAPPGQSVMGFAMLSPDGRSLLLQLRDEGGKNQLAVRALDSLDVRLLPGTENSRGGFWAPDGKDVAFFAEGKLKRMGAEGGPARNVCESGGAVWGAWGPDGTILFAKRFGDVLFRVSASGGEPVPALDAKGDFVHQNQPAFLPDGKHFVYLASNAGFSKKQIALGALGSKESRPLCASLSSPTWADPGWLVFAREDGVLAQRVDPKTLKLVGEPVPVFSDAHWSRSDDFLSLSAAAGRVAYMSWALRRRLAWVDRKGREFGTLGEVAGYTDVRISPDGRRVAAAIRDAAHAHNNGVWILDAARGTAQPLTTGPTDDFNPSWFPDGQRIAYVSDRNGFYNIFERAAAGGVERALVSMPRDAMLPSVFPDGRRLLLSISHPPLSVRNVVSLDAPDTPTPLAVDAGFSEEHPALSPDGRSCAFDSIESGQREVYVQSLPNGPKRQVSVGGGQVPVWSRNGRELFYASREGTLMSVAFPFGPLAEPAAPLPLFPLELDVSGELPWGRLPYDVTPDGERFLVIRSAKGVEPDGVVVVSNWTAALKGKR